MRGAGALSVAAVVAGVALIAGAVALGQATVALVVVVPVVFGHSPLLAGGIGLVLLGWVGVMLTAGAGEPEGSSPGAPARSSPGALRSGGLVLIGPVPIVWGSGASISRRTRWLLAALGGLLLALALALVLIGR